ncbi:hypothetical protein ACFU3O_14545 [Streptomyces antibioticus]|uniref:hypothetical protein n=1 Tax=Streptomyces antibioticus TaxID=1890 RepID=UPI0036BA1ABF
MSGAALVLLHDAVPLPIANGLITIASTVIGTKLHQRVTFRSSHGGWTVHLRSALTVALSYLFTTAALLVLDEVSPDPSIPVHQAVYLSASGIAGAARFMYLRAVFSRVPPAVPHVRQPDRSTLIPDRFERSAT